MQSHVLNMFNKNNEQSCFYFQVSEWIHFPGSRFDMDSLKTIDDEGEKKWENLRLLFEDNDVISLRLFHNAKEFFIRPISPKTIKI